MASRTWISTVVALLLAVPIARGGYTLHSQLDLDSGMYVSAQDYEGLMDPLDCEAADDFTVDGLGWHITDVITTWASPPMLADALNAGRMNVGFYADDGGKPAATPIAFFTEVAPSAVTGRQVTTPVDVTLDPGEFWVSFQMQLNYGLYAQALLSTRLAASGDYAIWRNPGMGVTTSAPDWTSFSDLWSEFSDTLFALEGTEVVPEPGSLIAASLLAAGTFGSRLRRRRRRH